MYNKYVHIILHSCIYIYIYTYVYTSYGNTICQNLHLDTGNRWKQIIPVYYLKGRWIFQAIESSQDLSRALVTRIAAAKVEIRRGDISHPTKDSWRIYTDLYM